MPIWVKAQGYMHDTQMEAEIRAGNQSSILNRRLGGGGAGTGTRNPCRSQEILGVRSLAKPADWLICRVRLGRGWEVRRRRFVEGSGLGHQQLLWGPTRATIQFSKRG